MVERFVAQKWYRYVGNERMQRWNPEGAMDFALDGRPRRCRWASTSEPMDAGFEPVPSESRRSWSWHHGRENWRELKPVLVTGNGRTEPVIHTIDNRYWFNGSRHTDGDTLEGLLGDGWKLVLMDGDDMFTIDTPYFASGSESGPAPASDEEGEEGWYLRGGFARAPLT